MFYNFITWISTRPIVLQTMFICPSFEKEGTTNYDKLKILGYCLDNCTNLPKFIF